MTFLLLHREGDAKPYLEKSDTVVERLIEQAKRIGSDAGIKIYIHTNDWQALSDQERAALQEAVPTIMDTAHMPVIKRDIPFVSERNTEMAAWAELDKDAADMVWTGGNVIYGKHESTEEAANRWGWEDKTDGVERYFYGKPDWYRDCVPEQPKEGFLPINDIADVLIKQAREIVTKVFNDSWENKIHYSFYIHTRVYDLLDSIKRAYVGYHIPNLSTDQHVEVPVDLTTMSADHPPSLIWGMDINLMRKTKS